MVKIMTGIQKGGVGKSTTTAIVAEILAASGYSVLVVDLDSQGNVTEMLTQRNIYEFSGNTVLEAVKERNPNPYIVELKENLSILPAEDMLATFSRWLYVNDKTLNPARVLQETLDNLNMEYDFVLMDCPPNLGDIVANAVSCADYVIIPVQPEAFALNALDKFLQFIGAAQEDGYTEAELLGIACTMVDGRNAVHRSIIDVVREKHGEKVFKSEIRLRAKIKEYALIGTQMKRKVDADALQDYISLTEEMIYRVKEQQN